MPRYPKQPLEERLAWMRERQIQKKAAEDARAREESRRAEAGAVTPPIEAMLRDLLTLVQHPPVTRPAVSAVQQMLRVDQVAEILSVSARTVQRWFADRAIIVETGPTKTTMLIPKQALDDWFREHAPKKVS